MDNVIEFPKPEPDKPDADCVSIIVEDGKPVKWFKFGLSFEASDGKSYGTEIWATSWEDAEARMAAIRVNGHISGQIYAQIPGQ